jgi:AcrR family transcriptional regulator
VLSAALDLFTKLGIDQVRLAEIARQAGMSSGQVMHYFTTKEHILLETLAWQERQISSQRLADLPQVAGAWQQVECFADLYLPSGPADPAWILWTQAWGRALHNADVAAFLDELVQPWEEELAEIAQRGAQEGAFSLQVPPGDFATCYCAMLDGLGLMYLNQRRTMPRERLIEMAMTTARAQLTPAARDHA